MLLLRLWHPASLYQLPSYTCAVLDSLILRGVYPRAYPSACSLQHQDTAHPWAHPDACSLQHQVQPILGHKKPRQAGVQSLTIHRGQISDRK